MKISKCSNPVLMIPRLESDYYGIHIINILGVVDLPTYFPKTRMKNWTKFERNFNIVQLTILEKFQIITATFNVRMISK